MLLQSAFCEPLALVHTHEGAKKAIDAMATRFTPRESDVEPIRVWQNLQNLSDRRHRKLQDGYINSAECLRFVSEFLMSNMERTPLRARTGAILIQLLATSLIPIKEVR